MDFFFLSFSFLKDFRTFFLMRYSAWSAPLQRCNIMLQQHTTAHTFKLLPIKSFLLHAAADVSSRPALQTHDSIYRIQSCTFPKSSISFADAALH